MKYVDSKDMIEEFKNDLQFKKNSEHNNLSEKPEENFSEYHKQAKDTNLSEHKNNVTNFTFKQQNERNN